MKIWPSVNPYKLIAVVKGTRDLKAPVCFHADGCPIRGGGGGAPGCLSIGHSW